MKTETPEPQSLFLCLQNLPNSYVTYPAHASLPLTSFPLMYPSAYTTDTHLMEKLNL